MMPSALRTTCLTLAVAASVIGTLAARQQPARNAIGTPLAGTAVISGTVLVDEPGGKPVRRATVSISPTGSNLAAARMTTTDDLGRFAFTRLPPGNYSPPRVTKGGFVEAVYGQKRFGGIGTPVTLTEGQRLTIALKMVRGGVITGVILDQGRPVPSTSVSATSVRIVNGERIPATQSLGGRATSDDRGVYRMFGLQPGDYVVSISPRSSVGGELRPVSPEEIKWAQQQLQAGGVAGTASSVSSAQPPKPAQAVTYAPVYYPGSTQASQATVVSVAAGKERGGIDFNLQFVSTARVEGTIVDPNGEPALNPQVNMVPKLDPADLMTSDPFFMLDSMMMARPTFADGKFSLTGVRPGSYTIAVRAAPRGAGGSASPGGRGGGPAPMTLWGSTDVVVDGADLSGIEVRLAPGMELSGRVVFEGTTLQPPADLSRVIIRMSSAPNPSGVSVSINVPGAQVKPDGTFTLEGVTPGRYFLIANAPNGAPSPTGSWVLKSSRVGDVDAADTPFEVRPSQNIGDVVVTFTDKTSELSGTLLDANGHPTPDFSIMLFATDRSMWSQRSRRLRAPVRAGTDGKFKFGSLLPGEYYLAALTDFEPGDVYKPEFLEQVAAAATKVVLGEGEKKVQDLKIAGTTGTSGTSGTRR